MWLIALVDYLWSAEDCTWAATWDMQGASELSLWGIGKIFCFIENRTDYLSEAGLFPLTIDSKHILMMDLA